MVNGQGMLAWIALGALFAVLVFFAGRHLDMPYRRKGRTQGVRGQADVARDGDGGGASGRHRQQDGAVDDDGPTEPHRVIPSQRLPRNSGWRDG